LLNIEAPFCEDSYGIRRIEASQPSREMSGNVPESFNGLIWHDSKVRSLRIVRTEDDLDEVRLGVELRGISSRELTPITVTPRGRRILLQRH
jgi:hypothetical protein